MRELLEFRHKGDRTYVHSADFYDATLKFSAGATDIDIMFHAAIIGKNVILTDAKESEDVRFTLKYSKDGIRHTFYAYEAPSDMGPRYEYDESFIYGDAVLDKDVQTIILEKHSPYSFIENVVGLNKYLLSKLYEDKKGKWWATRFQFKYHPQTQYPIKVTLKSNFNFQLTKSEIYADSKLVGYIYFSLLDNK